jgi:DNA polymerase elongation subunit (family B)
MSIIGKDLVVWPITIDAIEQSRMDNPAWSGDCRKDITNEAAYRDAAHRTTGDATIPEFRRRFTIRVSGLTQENEKVYIEVDHPKELKLQFPVACSSDQHVKAALRMCETAKKLPTGYFSVNYNKREQGAKCFAFLKPQSYAVGYIPDDDMNPRKWPMVILRINTVGMWRSVVNFFRYTDIKSPFGRFKVEIHEVMGGKHLDLFTFQTGVMTATWCIFKSVVPFRAKGVSLCATEGITRTAEVHPEPTPPPPDVKILMYDLECVGNDKDKWLAVRDIPSERCKLPDPNQQTHEVRMISSHLFGLKSHDQENIIFEYRSPFTEITDIQMRGCTYKVIPFETELDMILSFLDYCRGKSEVWFGYNNHLFDLPYLFVRVNLLSKGKSIRRWLVLGSLPGDRYCSFYSPEMGSELSVLEESSKRNAIHPWAVGTVCLDMIDLLRSGKFGAYKNYKLKSTSELILGKESKDPLTYIDIADCLHGTMSPERYKELCEETGIAMVDEPNYADQYALVRHYCFLDSDVLRRMFVHISMWDTLCSTSAMNDVTLQTVCDKKSKILVTTGHAKLCYERDIVLNLRFREDPMPLTEDGKAFEGGAVLDATAGLHACCPDTESASVTKSIPEQYLDMIVDICSILPPHLAAIVFIMCDYFMPLVTLDLEAMYPSIMRKWNLSGDTCLIPGTPYAPELFDQRLAKQRGTKWITVNDIIPKIDPAILRKLGPGYWPDAPMNDKYNAFVVPSPIADQLPRVMYVVKSELYDGVYNTMVGRAFDGRRDRKKLMKTLTGINKHAVDIAGESERVDDHRAMVATVDRMRKEEIPIKVEELPELLGMSMKQIAGAAESGATQADSEQAVLKIINNAMYGANGFVAKPRDGQKPKPPQPTECLEVAAIVTAVGRQMNKEMEDHLCDGTHSPYKEWGVWRAIGDTDSVIVKYPCEDMEEAFDKADHMAKDLTINVWGDDRKRILEVDGVTPYAYVGGKKNRCELLYVKRDAKPKRKVSGMCPTKKNDPLVKRAPIQAFVDLVFDVGAMRITGFRLLLIASLHKCFEKMVIRPEEGGYELKAYSSSTLVGQMTNLKTPHLVALQKRCKRQGVPISYYKGQYMAWVTIKGVGKPTLRTEDTDWAKWEQLDRLYAFTNTVAPIIRKTIVDKPWVHDGSPILSKQIWAIMYDTYKNILSVEVSSMPAQFMKVKKSTPAQRLNLFIDRFVKDAQLNPPVARANPTTKRKPEVSIASFFTKKTQ